MPIPPPAPDRKYYPLYWHLLTRPPEQARCTLTYAELGALVGGLPPSAWSHPGFWANTTAHLPAHTRAWLAAGWHVAGKRRGLQTVTFERAASPG